MKNPLLFLTVFFISLGSFASDDTLHCNLEIFPGFHPTAAELDFSLSNDDYVSVSSDDKNYFMEIELIDQGEVLYFYVKGPLGDSFTFASTEVPMKAFSQGAISSVRLLASGAAMLCSLQ